MWEEVQAGVRAPPSRTGRCTHGMALQPVMACGVAWGRVGNAWPAEAAAGRQPTCSRTPLAVGTTHQQMHSTHGWLAIRHALAFAGAPPPKGKPRNGANYLSKGARPCQQPAATHRQRRSNHRASMRMLQPTHAPVFLGPQGSLSSSRGGPFATLNGALAPEVLVVCVPGGKELPGPLHVIHVSSGGVRAGSTSCLHVSKGLWH